MHHPQGPRRRNRLEDRKRDGMVAASDQGLLSRREDRFKEAADILMGALQMKDIRERHVAHVRHPAGGERVESRDVMNRAHHGRHVADFARAEACARPCRHAPIERHARQGDVEILESAGLRHPHESGNAAVARQALHRSVGAHCCVPW
ncbi:hypothetical protein D3C72_1758200 [compost metagenome]